MTVDYTKISEQMNKSPAAKPMEAGKKFYTKPPGAQSLLSNKNKPSIVQIVGLLIMFGGLLYFAPILVVLTAVFAYRNKNIQSRIKNILKGYNIDITKNSVTKNIYEQVTEKMPQEQRESIKEMLGEYNIKTEANDSRLH